MGPIPAGSKEGCVFSAAEAAESDWYTLWRRRAGNAAQASRVRARSAPPSGWRGSLRRKGSQPRSGSLRTAAVTWSETLDSAEAGGEGRPSTRLDSETKGGGGLGIMVVHGSWVPSVRPRRLPPSAPPTLAPDREKAATRKWRAARIRGRRRPPPRPCASTAAALPRPRHELAEPRAPPRPRRRRPARPRVTPRPLVRATVTLDGRCFAGPSLVAAVACMQFRAGEDDAASLRFEKRRDFASSVGRTSSCWRSRPHDAHTY